MDVSTSNTPRPDENAMNTCCHDDTSTTMSATVSVTSAVSADLSERAVTMTSNTSPSSDNPINTSCHDEALSYNVAVDGAVSDDLQHSQVDINNVTCQTSETATLAHELLSQLKTSGIPDEAIISTPKGLLQQLLELGKDLQ